MRNAKRLPTNECNIIVWLLTSITIFDTADSKIFTCDLKYFMQSAGYFHWTAKKGTRGTSNETGRLCLLPLSPARSLTVVAWVKEIEFRRTRRGTLGRRQKGRNSGTAVQSRRVVVVAWEEIRVIEWGNVKRKFTSAAGGKKSWAVDRILRRQSRTQLIHLDNGKVRIESSTIKFRVVYWKMQESFEITTSHVVLVKKHRLHYESVLNKVTHQMKFVWLHVACTWMKLKASNFLSVRPYLLF